MKTSLSIVSTVLLCLFLSSGAYAVPNLQVYIPDASYINETWEIVSSNFELQVIAANKDLYDIYLTMAVPDGETGTITLTSQSTGDIYTYSTSSIPSDFTVGTPSSAYGTLPGHGIFPGYYAEHSLGNIPLGSDTVYDMVGGGSATGSILKFDVAVSGFTSSHYDLYGYYYSNGNNCKRHFVFAPFSHDGGSRIPEPASLTLLGLGLLGLLAKNKIKKNRRTY